jgi:hypothetical protein
LKIDCNQITRLGLPSHHHPTLAQVTTDKIPTPDQIIGAKNTGLLGALVAKFTSHESTTLQQGC